MQVDPIKLVLKAPGSILLKLINDGPLSNLASNFNLRRYSKDAERALKEARAKAEEDSKQAKANANEKRRADIREMEDAKAASRQERLVGRCRLTLSHPR